MSTTKAFMCVCVTSSSSDLIFSFSCFFFFSHAVCWLLPCVFTIRTHSFSVCLLIRFFFHACVYVCILSVWFAVIMLLLFVQLQNANCQNYRKHRLRRILRTYFKVCLHFSTISSNIIARIWVFGLIDNICIQINWIFFVDLEINVIW